jgi:hypothetical protein
MATAHKIAVIFYTMIKNQVEYDETTWDARDAQREKKLQAKHYERAPRLRRSKLGEASPPLRYGGATE